MSIFEEKLIKPYLPNKIVSLEYIRQILNGANQDFLRYTLNLNCPINDQKAIQRKMRGIRKLCSSNTHLACPLIREKHTNTPSSTSA
jgi:hypothetical protein